MPSDGDEGDMMGPGMDLALSLSGIMIIVVLVIVAQFWLNSSTAKQKDTPFTVSELLKKLRGTQDQLTNIKGELQQQKDRVSDLTARLDGAEKKHQQAQDSLTAAGKSITELKSFLHAKDRELTATTAKVREGAELAKSLHDQIDKLDDRVELLSNNYADEKNKRSISDSHLDAANARIIKWQDQLAKLDTRLNDRPPLITISDATFRTFLEGSADISPALDHFLESIVPQLRELGNRYGAKVIEVIGHTDEIRIGSSKRKNCNIDSELVDVLNGHKEAKILEPCDNVGLGMARATAVVNELRKLGMGQDFILLPLSAGQAIDTDGMLAHSDEPIAPIPARRRIEIRLRRPDT